MLDKLRPAEYELVRPLYAGWRYNLRVNSLLNGYNRGRIYVDNLSNPRTAIAWIHDLFYLAGDEDNDRFNRSFERWMSDVIAPQAREEGLGYFAVQAYPLEPWQARIQELVPGRELQMNREWKFTFHPLVYRQIRTWPKLPPGFAIQRVEREMLLDPNCRAVLNAVQRWAASVEVFLERGFGFVLRHGEALVSSGLSVYVDRELCELGVTTYDAQDRHHGFATLVARACIDHCLAQRLTPVWSADEGNEASLALAQKLAFEKVGEYPDWYFLFE